MGQYEDQVQADATMPEHRRAQGPVVMEIEPLERPVGVQIISVSRDVCPIGVLGERQDVQAELSRPGNLLTRAARLAGTETHPQGGMPDQEAVHSRRGIRYRAALGQVDPSSHAELVAALPHILQERLLAPGQGLSAGLRPGKLNGHLVLIDPVGHDRLWATTDCVCQPVRWPSWPDFCVAWQGNIPPDTLFT